MKRLPFLFLAFLFFLPAISIAKELPKIAVWDLAPGDIKGAYAQDLTSILASEVNKLGKYEVYSQDNVRTLAGWTEQRMTLGCTDTKCLTALGQMDIAKLISGRVGKIGNTYSISLNLFDTRNARSENVISEFCRTEDELIVLVQQAVRKLLGVQAHPPASPSTAVDKTPPPFMSPSSPSASLEIKTKVQGAKVYFNGQDLGEAPVRVPNVAIGLHEVRVTKQGYEDWKQSIQFQSNEKKMIEVVLKRSAKGEDYFIDRIFYFENCFVGREKFAYLVKFIKGGLLQGAPMNVGPSGIAPKQPISFKPLEGRWVMEKNKIIIHPGSIIGMPFRRFLAMEVQLDGETEDTFQTVVEFSTDVVYQSGQPLHTHGAYDGRREKHTCVMKKLPSP